MGEALLVFTFSPRGPRTPAEPWWTRNNMFVTTHQNM